MNSPLKCPVCDSHDICEYVFYAHHNYIEHEDNHELSNVNPSNLHRIFLCPKLHFFDENAKPITIEQI